MVYTTYKDGDLGDGLWHGFTHIAQKLLAWMVLICGSHLWGLVFCLAEPLHSLALGSRSGGGTVLPPDVTRYFEGRWWGGVNHLNVYFSGLTFTVPVWRELRCLSSWISTQAAPREGDRRQFRGWVWVNYLWERYMHCACIPLYLVGLRSR